MEYKDFIYKGSKVICDLSLDSRLTEREKFDCPDAFIVTIGKYRPYYTDGSADPIPEEYDETCQVEAYSEIGETLQVRLETLLPIIKPETDKLVIYADVACNLIGTSCYGYLVIELDGNLVVASEGDAHDVRDIDDMSFDELKELRDEIVVGSCFIADYRNSFGIDPHLLSSYCDNYLDYLCEEYGEENYLEHDTGEEFANYMME